MNNQSKKLIIFIIVLLIASSAFLFCAEKYYKTTAENDWWAAYFEDPKNNNLDFVIENKKSPMNFQWELWLDNNKIKEGKENVAKDEKKNVEMANKIPTNYKGRVILKISSGEGKREIYKNF